MRLAASPTTDSAGDTASRRLTWLRRWLAVCGLLLVAATWRLWTPQEVFPQVPFVAVLRDAPALLDWIGLAGMLVALLGMLVTPSRHRSPPAAAGRAGEGRLRRADRTQPTPLIPDSSPQEEGDRRFGVLRVFAILFVASIGLLVLLDQHRFQPWAYQFAIVAIALAFAPAGRAASLLRLLAVGVYFWSAVSKFDISFLHGLGPDLLRGLLTALRLDPQRFDAEALATAAWAFPIGELAVATLLGIRRTRPVGLFGAVLMHVALLATLGPLGLNHEAGVLLWNVYFIGQNVLLFGPRASRGHIRHRSPPAAAGGNISARVQSAEGAPPAPLTPSPSPQGEGDRIPSGKERTGRIAWHTPAARRVADVLIFAAVGLPVLEPFGLLDHWPGWAVYAPGAERVTLLIDADAENRLPEGLREHLGPPDFVTGDRVLRTDLWSLDALSAPIYPQGRFRAGVALAVIERYALGEAARLVVETRADRLSGERTRIEYVGRNAVRRFAESFRLNALPRKP